MDEALRDERFQHILTDRRFRSAPRHVKKVTVDKRFKAMFTDKKFKGRGLVDKRGRPINLTPSEDLRNLYQETSESSENEDDGENIKSNQKSVSKMKGVNEKVFNKPSNKKNAKETHQLFEEEENSSEDDNSDIELYNKGSNIKCITDKKSKSKMKKHSESFSVNIKDTKISEKQPSEKLELSSEDDLRECKGNFTDVKPKHSETVSSKKKKCAKKNKSNNNSQIDLSLLSNKELSSIIDDDSKESSEAEKNAISIVNAHLKDKDSEISPLKKKKSPKVNVKQEKSPRNQLSLLSNKELSSIIDNDSKESSAEETHVKKKLVSKKMNKKKTDHLKNQSPELSVEQELSSELYESGEERNDNSVIIESYKSKIKPVKNASNAKEKLHSVPMKQKQSSFEEEDSEEESSEDDDSDEKSTEEPDDKISKRKSTVKNGLNYKDSEDSDSDDSDDSESDDSSGEQNEYIDHRWEELQNDAPDTDEITRRLAVCNMDWDRIKAEDLYVCFKSFKPVDGWINSVKIYPSEFGLKRMEEEKLHGPAELVEETLSHDEEEIEDKKGSRHHREKLRQYQINRLKYYYAIVDCDSPETANALYEQLNGMEYESSSIRYDLRFVPDDTTFEHEPVSVADNNTDLTNYQPRLFVNTALQQVQVNLTWDETDPKRREVLQRAFTDPDSVQDDIRTYLASSSGESESDEEETISNEKHSKKIEDRIATYRKLLQSIEEEEKEEKEKYEMEITWDPSLKEKTEEIIKDKMKKDTLNPFEEMLQKRKEKRKMKNKEKKTMSKEAESNSESDDSDESESMAEDKAEDAKKLAELALIADSKKEVDDQQKKRKKKKKVKKDIAKVQKADNFKVDVNDPRFSAIYTSHMFNIDPSDPHFKKTDGNVALIKEKQRRLHSKDFQERNAKRGRYS